MMPFVSSMDLTWYKVTLAKWAYVFLFLRSSDSYRLTHTHSMVEINVGIICSCLPVMRPLLIRFFPAVFGSHASSGVNPIRRADGKDTFGAARKKVIRNWDYLSTVKGTHAGETAHDVESLHEEPKHDNGSAEPAIMMATEYSVTCKRRSD